NMSAMGSLMLIDVLLRSSRRSPAGLDHARDVALEGELADLVARQAEQAEGAARAPCQRAAAAQPCGIRVARKLLQLQAREVALLLGALLVADDALELGALLRVLGDQLFALGLALLD